MTNGTALRLFAVGAIGALGLASCSSGSSGGTTTDGSTNADGGVSSYTVGGNVSGLLGSGLVLQLNGTGDLSVSASGPFTFASPIAKGSNYTVSVKTQPSSPSQTCTVMSGSGTVGSANVAAVSVVCATDAYPVGGTVSGLTGTVVLQNNAGDDLTVSASGQFSFVTPVAAGANYAVTVKTHPVNQLCAVASGSGIATAAVSSVTVTCATPQTCKAIKAAIPGSADGTYMVDPDGAGPLAALGVFCDMTTDGGGYTEYQVTGGISTSMYNQANSCQALGLNIVIPRTKAHFAAMYKKFGAGSFVTVPGIYGKVVGNYTTCVMNSGDAACGANWVAIDQGTWWLRDTKYTEPNGDYQTGCWLSFTGFDGNGDSFFNDGTCSYSTGATYVCSDNAK